MYEYISMRRTSRNTSKYEAPDELIVNGKTLTSLFGEGVYRQLNVTGRGIKPFYVESTNFLNRSGANIDTVKVDPIEIDVQYMVKTKSSEELREVFNTLQRALSGTLTISFKDEPDYVYEDVVLTFTMREEEDSYTHVSLFTLTAYNPYRIGSGIKEASVLTTQADSVPITKISIMFSETISNPTVELYDGRYWTDFKVNANVSSGDTLTINIDEDLGKVTFGGSVPKNAINLGDLPQNMVLFNGARGRVKGSNSSDVTLAWRDVKL